jgi:hypothetical protein
MSAFSVDPKTTPQAIVSPRRNGWKQVKIDQQNMIRAASEIWDLRPPQGSQGDDERL